MVLKEQKFGIEIEMTGITRAKAAEVTAEYFGTRVKYLGTYYDTYAAIDTEGRQWKFMSDGSITAQKKSNGRKINAGREYQTEMVSPICRYEDIVTIQEIIRKPVRRGLSVPSAVTVTEMSPTRASSVTKVTTSVFCVACQPK